MLIAYKERQKRLEDGLFVQRSKRASSSPLWEDGFTFSVYGIIAFLKYSISLFAYFAQRWQSGHHTHTKQIKMHCCRNLMQQTASFFFLLASTGMKGDKKSTASQKNKKKVLDCALVLRCCPQPAPLEERSIRPGEGVNASQGTQTLFLLTYTLEESTTSFFQDFFTSPSSCPLAIYYILLFLVFILAIKVIT